jgi:hypothetical protein
VIQTPGAPELSILVLPGGNQIKLSWPDAVDSWSLQYCPSLTPSDPGSWIWIPLEMPYERDGRSRFVILPVADGQRYYRLEKN